MMDRSRPDNHLSYSQTRRIRGEDRDGPWLYESGGDSDSPANATQAGIFSRLRNSLAGSFLDISGNSKGCSYGKDNAEQSCQDEYPAFPTHTDIACHQPVLNTSSTFNTSTSSSASSSLLSHFDNYLATPIVSSLSDPVFPSTLAESRTLVSLTSDSTLNSLPLTPLSSSEFDIHLLSLSPTNFEDHWNNHDAYSHQPDARKASIQINDHPNRYSHAEGVNYRKGKDPAPPFPFETLLADVSTESPASTEKTLDDEEWYGLQYTLELSRKDRRPSETSTTTAGEHSKSRESWAAIHQESVHPLCEDRAYYQWQRWHQQLDREEKKNRQLRTSKFMQESELNANLYADEMYARRLLMMCEAGVNDKEAINALEWIEYASERYPDPYFPPQRHNSAWVLRNHRSIGSIRDLVNLRLNQ